MSTLLGLIASIRDTQAEIARAERSIANGEASFSVEIAAASLGHRLRALEEEFSAATAEAEVDVCSYRLLPESGQRYSVATIGTVFTNFQQLFTVIYESIKTNRPRKRAKVPPETRLESAFDFGYSFQGSLGFVFTLSNERLLLGQSLLDMAMSSLMDLPRASNAAQVSEFAKKYGAAPLHLAYEWARVHADAGLSVEVNWQRGGDARLHLLAPASELRRLADLIAATGETTREKADYYGELVGIDVLTKTFHLLVDGKTDIRGHLADTFQPPDPLTIRKWYTASLLLERRLQYATGIEEAKFYLLSLNAKPEVTSGA